MKLLALILTLLTFSAGTAWALDAHLEVFAGHQATIGAGGDTDVSHAADNEACDHCCHASAHLMGLPITATDTVCTLTPERVLAVSVHLRSLRVGPATPPPLG